MEELFVPKNNPFVKFKVGKLWTPTRKRAISKGELDKIIALKLSKATTHYLDFARDVFLFTYFTAGINICDIANLQYCNINNGRVQYVRSKTGKEINCKLMPMAEEIIAKYSNPSGSPTDYIFPILNRNVHRTELQKYNRIHKVTQKVNKQLKELGRLTGITTPISSYVARHTYASQLKFSGVSTAIISQSLGHSSEKVTQVYLDSFGNEQIDEAMKNLL